MSTTGIQNYLSNVFRQVYTYDSTLSVPFVPKLELSNIDTYSGNALSVFTAAVGDSASNVYVGSNAGNPYNVIRSCSNVTALGYGAGSNISNVSNSVYLGFGAGAGAQVASAVIAIGSNANGGGTSNIAIGNGTGSVGASNVLIGHSIAPGNVSNQIRIGYNGGIPIAADLCRNWVGLGGILSPRDITYANVDVSGSTHIQGNLGINITPGTRTLDVNGNFRAQDASMNALDFSNGFTRSTGGYVSIQSNISVPATGSSTIGTIRKGIIHVSALNGTGTNRAAYIYFAWTDSNVTALASTSNGVTNITTSTTNIQISNSGGSPAVHSYSITYFPLP